MILPSRPSVGIPALLSLALSLLVPLLLHCPAASLSPPPPPLGFSFTPSGLAFPYQIGVASTLASRGYVARDVPLAGSSGGGLAAFVAAVQGGRGGLSFSEALAGALRVNDLCRERGTRGNLRDVLDETLGDFFGGGRGDVYAATLAARRETDRPLTIGILRFDPWPSPYLVSAFEGPDDVRGALLATSCIPFFFARTPTVLYRGRPALDGIFSTEAKFFGAPDAVPARRTVRVCPFPDAIGEEVRGERGRDLIAPTTEELGKLGLAEPGEFLKMAIGTPCADNRVLEGLFAIGARNAERWIEAQDAA